MECSECWSRLVDGFGQFGQGSTGYRLRKPLKNRLRRDLKFPSKNEAARVLLATLGINDGEGDAGLALAELASDLVPRSHAPNGKVIEHSEQRAPLAASSDSYDDRVVETVEC